MWLLILLPIFVLGQKPPPVPPVDPEAMVQNVDNIRRLYGIATRIMEMSGAFMGQGSGAGSSSGAWDDLRPRAQSSGVRNFESDNSVTAGGDGQSEFSRFREDFGLLGGFLSTAPPTTTPRPFQSGIQGLLNTFFGSSVDDSEPLPTPPTPRPRQGNFFGSLLGAPPPQAQQRQSQSPSSLGQINLWELFGVTRRTTTTTPAPPPLQSLLNPQLASGSAQNLDAVFNALMRSNAQPERPQPSTNIFSQFFGRR
ncbi:hypothetical protein V3C99_019144 [Haemonchus contortus]|uniref:Odontogenic ameloblast-associated protein n=1 Tax=Haemonchus contortus TaxID=6289 RepID=A0A7I4Z2U5_HAECO